ncbi:hypothetical protein WJT74_06390 [Sphingomicrobium sp. XHP0239]|uniref:hypothetical protein n=1 Tax=Sphingomicrobium maritimum TaxID=3133972 RepID=UPI0031CC81F2
MQIKSQGCGVNSPPELPTPALPIHRPFPVLTFEGTKGGISKSFTANSFAAALERRAIGWAGFDGDFDNAHLARFNADADVTRFHSNAEIGWDRLFEAILDVDPAKAVLLDLPSQVGEVFQRELPRLEATLRYVERPHLRLWVCAPGYDSVNLLRGYGRQVSFDRSFAVLSLRKAKREDFSLWDNSKTRRDFLDGGGQEIVLPNMPDGLRKVIDEKGLSLNSAAAQLWQYPWLVEDLEAFLAQIDETFAPVIRRFA